jgi:ABC-2 type transport system permease protein
MTDAIRYEWTRIRTIRSTYWLSAIAVLFGVGLSFLVAMGTHFSFDSSQPPSRGDLRGFGAGVATQFAWFGVPYFVGYILAMISVFAWGHEYRHGMIRATLTAVPDRITVWAAKYVVVALWVTAMAAVISVASMLVGALILSGTGVDVLTAGGWRMAVRCAAYTLVLTWLVTAFTAVVRQQVVALVLMFLWPFLLENVVSGVVTGIPWLSERFAGAVRFLPFDAGSRMIREEDVVFGDSSDVLTAWEGFAVFGGFCLVLMALSLVLFQRRDA